MKTIEASEAQTEAGHNMAIYTGLFCDKFFDVEASSESEAQEKLLQILLLYLKDGSEFFAVWDSSTNILDKLPDKPLQIVEK